MEEASERKRQRENRHRYETRQVQTQGVLTLNVNNGSMTLYYESTHFMFYCGDYHYDYLLQLLEFIKLIIY